MLSFICFQIMLLLFIPPRKRMLFLFSQRVTQSTVKTVKTESIQYGQNRAVFDQSDSRYFICHR